MDKEKKGMFITFEGIDTSGKSTQAELLATRLELEGHKVKLFHFPMYERPIGKFIGDILASRVKSDMGNDAMQMLYVADQMAFQEELRGYIDEGYTVICDRYDLSTVTYYSMMPGKTLSDAIQTVYKHWQARLLKPDVTYILDLQPEQITKRKQRLDIFEKNILAMHQANKNYGLLSLMLQDRNIAIMNASDDIEAIMKDVYGYLKAHVTKEVM